MSDPIRTIRLNTDHVSVLCAHVVWDEETERLAMAVIVEPFKQTVKALMAALIGKRTLTLEGVDWAAYRVRGFGRKPFTLRLNLEERHIRANVLAVASPQVQPEYGKESFFLYHQDAPFEEGHRRFARHLDRMLPWPVQPEWGRDLAVHGASAGLVRTLRSAGALRWTGAWISPDPDAWKPLIEAVARA